MTHDELIESLSDWLHERNRIKVDDRGNWGEIKQQTLFNLYTFFNEIITLKFEEDSDGDSPLDLHIIDRTKCEPSFFQAIPYTHDRETYEEDPEKLKIALRKAMMNQTVASGTLEQLLRKLFNAE